MKMLCNYRYECDAHLQRGKVDDYSMHYSIKTAAMFRHQLHLM